MEKEKQGFLDFAYQLYKTMKTNEINLVYEGEVTQEITKTFTSYRKESYKECRIKYRPKKVFNVMVECLQNISKHADSLSDEEEERRGIVMVSKEKTHTISSLEILSRMKEFLVLRKPLSISTAWTKKDFLTCTKSRSKNPLFLRKAVPVLD